MQGPHSPVALQWHRVRGSHPDWRGQARGQRSTRYHFTLKREETEVGNYRLRDLGSPSTLQAAQPLGSKKAGEATQCVSPVSAGPRRNGKAPAPAQPWHPPRSSSFSLCKTACCTLLGRSWGDDPHEFNTRQQSCASPKIHLSFPFFYGIWG